MFTFLCFSYRLGYGVNSSVFCVFSFGMVLVPFCVGITCSVIQLMDMQGCAQRRAQLFDVSTNDDQPTSLSLSESYRVVVPPVQEHVLINQLRRGWNGCVNDARTTVINFKAAKGQ